MDSSIFLARVLGIYFLVISYVFILHHQWLRDVVKDIMGNKAAYFLMSIMTLIAGILLLVGHPKFTADWRSVITVIAWLVFAKGIIHLFLAEHIMAFKHHLSRFTATYYVGGVICLLLSLFLGYFGFYVHLLV